MVDIVLQELPSDSTRILLWHEHDQQLSNHFAFAQPSHFPKCERSSWHGLDIEVLLQKLTASQVWTFLPPNHAPPSNAQSTTIWHNMRQCKCQLCTSISTQPLSIPCPSELNQVDKEVQVAEKPTQFPVPDLNPKMRVQKTKCRYCKT